MAKRRVTIRAILNEFKPGAFEPTVAVFDDDETDKIGRTATRAEAHKYFDEAMKAYYAKGEGWEERYRDNLRIAHGVWCLGENNRRGGKTRRRPIGTGGDRYNYKPAIAEVRRRRKKDQTTKLESICRQICDARKEAFGHKTLARKCRDAGIS